MKRIEEGINSLSSFFNVNENVLRTEYVVEKRTDQANASVLRSKSSFYKSYSGFRLKWKPADADEYDLRISGSIYMLPEEKIFKDWKGIVYFDSTPRTDPIRSFMPVDLFSDDACAGIFLNDETATMHLYSYEGSPLNLRLTIDNYFLTSVDFRGFYFWQYIIRYFIDGQQNEVVQDYFQFSSQCKEVLGIEELARRFNERKG